MEPEELNRRVHTHRRAVRLLERNYRELALFLEYLGDSRIAVQTMDRRAPWLQQEAMEEVACLLHAFVAAADSFLDHSKEMYRRIYKPRKLIRSFKSQLDLRFTRDPESEFVRRLRNMMIHHSLPNVEFTMSFGQDKRIRTGYWIPIASLRTYQVWGPRATEYLDSHEGDAIDIGAAALAYFEKLRAFDTWFVEQQVRADGPGSHVFAASMRRTRNPEAREVVGTFLEQLNALPDDPSLVTLAALKDLYQPLLTVVDHRTLLLFQHEPRKWWRLAQEAAARRFRLPDSSFKTVESILARKAQPPLPSRPDRTIEGEVEPCSSRPTARRARLWLPTSGRCWTGSPCGPASRRARCGPTDSGTLARPPGSRPSTGGRRSRSTPWPGSSATDRRR